MQSFDLKNAFNESIYFDYVPPPTFAGHYNKYPFRVIITSSNDNVHTITLDSKFSKSYEPQYNQSKWSFLRPETKFFDLSGNQIQSVVTTDTKLYSGADGTINSISGTFIGVSGYAYFYFSDDIYNYDYAYYNQPHTLITAVLQTSAVDYFDTKESNHLQSSQGSNSLTIAYQPHIFRYREPDYIKISENGIREFINPRWVPVDQNVIFSFDWDSNISKTYDVKPIQPNSNFNKSLPSNTNTSSIILSANADTIRTYFPFNPTLKIDYKNSDGYFSPGYLKTLFYVGTGIQNMRLSAISTFDSPDMTGITYNPNMWISNPNAGLISRVNYNFPFIYDLPKYALLKANVNNIQMPIVYPANFRNGDDPFATGGHHDINSIAVMPYPYEGAWMVDGELNNLYKVDSSGDVLSAINLINLINSNQEISLPYLQEQASPTSIVIDGNLDMWITLYDNRYVLQLDKDAKLIGALDLTSTIPYVTPPNINNTWYEDQQPYPDDDTDQNYVQPTYVDTDTQNNIWVTYSNFASGYLVKYAHALPGQQVSNYIFQTVSFPLCSCPQDLIIDNQDNVWVALSNNIYNTIGSIEKRDTNGNLLSSFGPIMGVNNMALDLNQNLWFTYSYSRIGVIDNTTCEVKTFDVLENSNFAKGAPVDLTNPTNNTNETALEGIACDAKGYIYVINSIENQIYVYDSFKRKFIDNFYVNPQGFVFWNPYENGPTLFNYSPWNKSLQAYGDWIGTRWNNKYFKNLTGTYSKTISGISNKLKFINIPSYNLKQEHSFLATTFYQYIDTNYIQQIMVTPQQTTEPVLFYWNLDIYKVNEKYDLASQMQSYALTPSLFSSEFLFNKFLPSIYGTYPFNHDDLGVKIYEKIANYITNNNDIDTCEIDSLYSMSSMTNNDTDDYMLNYPAETKRLMNILSINPSKLFGAIPKNLNNFIEPDSKGNYNKGDLLYNSSNVYAGDPIILKTKSLNSYDVIQTGPIPILFLDKVSASLSNFSEIIMGVDLPADKIKHSVDNFIQTISSYNDAPKTTPNGKVINATYEKIADIINHNKSKLQLQIVEYVNYKYPNLMNSSLSAKCYRDTGYIVDAIVADIKNNANHRSIEVGNMYFKGVPAVSTVNVGSDVPNLPLKEVSPTIDAISMLKNYINGTNIPIYPKPFTSVGVLSGVNVSLEKKTQVSDLVDVVIYPLKNKGELLPYNPPGNPTLDDIDAANLILTNRSLIQDAVSHFVYKNAFIERTVTDPILLAEYTKKCHRDIGLWVDAIVNDIATGVFARSIQYALSYWDGSTTRLPLNTIPNHILYMKYTLEYLYEYILTFSLPPKVIPKTTPCGRANDPSYNSASQAILAAKPLIQQQIIDYTNHWYPYTLSSALLSATCYRDVGYIVDAIAADVANNANHRSIEVANIYFKGPVLNGVNLNSTIPTLPLEEVNITISAISAIGCYINGQNSEFLQTYTTLTSSGVLSSVKTGIARTFDVSSRVNDMVYTLKNRGELLPYNPPGTPLNKDLALADLLSSNRTYIQDTVSNFVLREGFIINTVFNPASAVYYTQKCHRDVGLMVDAVVNDLSTGVFARSIEYGLAYWKGSTSRLPQNVLPNQRIYTLATIQYLNDLMNSFNPTLSTNYVVNSYSVEFLADFVGLTRESNFWNSYYEFYKYIATDDNKLGYQDNVIDWNNPQTTFVNNVTSIFDWSGNEQTIDTLFSYDLYKGLGLIV